MKRPSISPISSKVTKNEVRRAINALIRWTAAIGIPVPTEKDVVTIENLVNTGFFKLENGQLAVIGWGGRTDILIETFTQTDLIAGVFTCTHAFGTQDLVIQVADENNKKMSPDDINATATHVIIDVTSWGDITGKRFRVIIIG
jgi:hypothetical protein